MGRDGSEWAREGRWDTGPNVDRPLAMMQDGKAWREDGHQLESFDRSAGVWHAVPFDTPEGFLLGAEGNSLVFLLRGQNTLRWVPTPNEFPAP